MSFAVFVIITKTCFKRLSKTRYNKFSDEAKIILYIHFVHLGYCGSSAIDDENAIIGFTMDNVNPDGSSPALMGYT